MHINYTCENCKSRNTWGCELCHSGRCEDFKLDEDTLSEEEKMLIRVMSYVMREQQ